MPLRSAGRGFDEEWPTVAAAREDRGNQYAFDDKNDDIDNYSRPSSSYLAPPTSAFGRSGGPNHQSHSAALHIQPSECLVTTPSYGPTPDDFSFAINTNPGNSSSSCMSVLSDANEMPHDDFDDDGIVIEEDYSQHQRRLSTLAALLHERRTTFMVVGFLATLVLGISLGTGMSNRSSSQALQNQQQWGLIPTSARYLPLRDALVELHDGDRTPFLSVDSLHHQALLFIADEDPRQLSPDDPSLGQRFALAMLFYSTYGMTWNSKRSWMTGETECDWEGVFCAHDGEHVDSIVLSKNGLKGNVSDLFLIHDLQQLDLSHNKGLQGSTVPESLGSLHLLRSVHLSGCGLVGTIPESLWTERIEIIDFSSNEITGHLSPAIKESMSLQKLLLENNSLDGPIPDAIGDLPLLNELRFGMNKFSGEIANLNKLAALRVLTLQDNQLTGSLPNLPPKIRVVDVSNNTLVGILGAKVTDLPELMELSVQGNFFSDNLDELDLSKSLSLELLYLNDNHFRSTKFPEWIAPLMQLRELKLYGNAGVVGNDIPDTVCDLVNFISLEILAIDCNHVVCTCCTHCCTALGECMQEKPDEFSM